MLTKIAISRVIALLVLLLISPSLISGQAVLEDIKEEMVLLEDNEIARLDKARYIISGLQQSLDEVENWADNFLTLDSEQLDCNRLGSTLWKWAKRQASHDDRPLYWTRLAAFQSLAQSFPRSRISPFTLRSCLDEFDASSRGRSDLSWKQDHFRVLVSGFDPFLLDQNIEQSNPSGLAALALDNQVLKAINGDLIHVRAVIFPVRFQDFDNGVVEAMLLPLLEDKAIDAYISISMGRESFDLERFPGRRRSASALDNANRKSGGSEDSPKVPRQGKEALFGPEFLEFNLPADRMALAPGRWAIRDNRTVTTLERGIFSANKLEELANQTAVRGSGGGYLSNEIAYRALNTMSKSNVQISMGHIHTPRMQNYDRDVLEETVDQIKGMLARLP